MWISNSPIMVRPTLIVGLGGTGVLICRWVEKYIKDLLGFVPPFIRFLKLDTDAMEEGGPADSSQSDFINLFHYMDVGEVVRDYAAHPEFHPHLDWLRTFRLDAAFADYGCQGIPRLGRLVFVELRDTVIHEAVATRFSDLRASTQKVMESDLAQFVVAPDGAPAVHIASSVCGGTGAGMLIDMAYNLRWWSRESFPRSAEIIGHLMLPEAFTVDPMLHPKLQAVAAATLEQIEFLTDSRRKDVQVRYREPDSDRCFGRLTAPFNLLYLLNGHGDTGSGNRRQLVKLIARVIRAMTVEPLAQRVTSDANNKLHDILGLMDPANGRRQCFASYGFWYGAPGHRRGDVDSWICAALEAMGSGPTFRDADYAGKIETQLGFHPDVSGMADGVKEPKDPFEWNRPGAAMGPEKMEADVVRRLTEYIETKLIRTIRDEANKSLPPNRPNKALLESAKKMIENEVFYGTPLASLGQVGVLLSQWERQLDKWLRDKCSAYEDVKRVGRGLVTAVKSALKDIEGGPTSWQAQDVNPVVKKVIDEKYWGKLVEAVLHENRLSSLAKTLEVLRLQERALDSMVSAASERGRVGIASDSPEDDGGDEDLFCTAFYAASDPTTDAGGLAGQFRQNLVRPILRHIVFALEVVKEGAGDYERIKDGLEDELRSLGDGKEEFLKDAQNDNYQIFHSRVPKGKPAPDHEYYRGVTDVLRLAAPKIELARTGVFARPLDVGISQHMEKICVGDLLRYNVGATFHEANVTRMYEDRTRAWFQLLRLRYGFCLEALSTYRDYVAATNDYVTRRGFTYSDVWLDHRWYNAYRERLGEWEGRRGAREGIAYMDRSTYDANAARIGTIRKLAHRILNALRKAIRSLTDVEQAIQATERYKETELDLDRMLDSLSPSEPVRVAKGLEDCLSRIKKLIDELDATLKDVHDRKRPEELEKDARECRAELMGLTTGDASSDEEGDSSG